MFTEFRFNDEANWLVGTASADRFGVCHVFEWGKWQIQQWHHHNHLSVCAIRKLLPHRQRQQQQRLEYCRLLSSSFMLLIPPNIGQASCWHGDLSLIRKRTRIFGKISGGSDDYSTATATTDDRTTAFRNAIACWAWRRSRFDEAGIVFQVYARGSLFHAFNGTHLKTSGTRGVHACTQHY